MEYFRNIYPDVEKVNKLINKNDKLIIFDTETTGLAKDAKIIQFSAVLYNIVKTDKGVELQVEDTFDTYINPEEKLDPIITELTGITDGMLKDKPNEREQVDNIKAFMSKASVWAAYNTPFDIKKLNAMYERTGNPEITTEWFDVLLMAKNLIRASDIENHKLGTVVEYLFPNYEAVFHNSLEDVKATGKVCEALLFEYSRIRTPEFPKRKIDPFVSYWQNPNKGSMRRLSVFDMSKPKGDRNTGIFWDLSNKCFSCNANKFAKNNFNSVDLPALERDILYKFGNKYKDEQGDAAETMEDLARNMEKAAKTKTKEQNDKKKEEIKPIENIIPKITNYPPKFLVPCITPTEPKEEDFDDIEIL